MTIRIQLASLLLAAGCAAAGRGASVARAPGPEALSGDAGAAWQAARAAETRGDAAPPEEGERARSEWARAAEGYAALAAEPPGTPFRASLLLRSAELRLRAQRWDEAAETSGSVVADAGAAPADRAAAARLAATASLAAASAAVKAGKLERLDLRAPPATPSPPPPAWKRVVEAADAFLAVAGSAKEPGRKAGVSAGEIALVAAEVQFAHGALEDARRRLESIEAASHDADVAARAGALLVATRFAEAERLLAAGEAGRAAKAFEEAAALRGAAAPANALHNAALAWDRAGDAGRAAGVRERILAEHATSPVAAEDALLLAAHRSAKKEHEAAAGVYERFLRDWPDSPSRCVALRNAASELDLAGRTAEAAGRYLAFGSDERCARGDPDLAARALVRAGRLYEARAKEAYAGAAALPGVAAPEAKGLVTEAKRRLRGM